MAGVFEGRVAVITGAASGIGKALAEALAARGCDLALADLNADGLEGVAAALRSNERRVTTHVLDVGDRDQISALADAVQTNHGGADLVFNNAGVALGGRFDEVDEADFDWLLGINLMGPIRMSRAFLPQLKASGAGHLINISSIFGVVAPAGQTAYSASKFGLRGFSDALRHELEGTGIHVTTVHPGGVKTSIARSARMPRGSDPEEVEKGLKQADKQLVMPPPEAARIILDAVERKSPRVLVGRDAKALALLERVFPATYWKRLSGFVRRAED